MMHVFIALIVFAAALVGASPSYAQAVSAPAAKVDSGYILGPGDVIEVEVLGQADFGKARVKLQPDGTVPLPAIGTIVAGGRTVQQLASQIEQKLVQAQYYKNPTVNVDIVSYASRYVIALGAVAQPGLVPIDRPYRLSEVIARVGGLKDGAADYVVLTSANGLQQKISVDALSRGGPGADPMVSPNDKLFVPTAETFYIYGQVNAPGAYPISERMTVRQALARGGGLTAMGSEGRLTVYRGGTKLRLSLDSLLRPGDTIVVGERLF